MFETACVGREGDKKSALNKFVQRNWSDYKLGVLVDWEEKINGCEIWFCSHFYTHNKSTTKTIEISFNGAFLINGNPIGKLPKEITTHADYIRIFGDIVFDVQESCESKESFVTVKSAGNDCDSYTFKMNEGKLIIKERQINQKKFVYLDNKYFWPILPFKLVHQYSHWLNLDENYIDFRPVGYKSQNFQEIFYKIDLNEKNLIEISTGRIMVDIHSKTFTEIYDKIIHLLEYKKYVQMFYCEKEEEFNLSDNIPNNKRRSEKISQTDIL